MVMNNNTIAVVGLSWGDEGKGKIVDFLTERADVIARYQGGNNAGHTVVIGGTSSKDASDALIVVVKATVQE